MRAVKGHRKIGTKPPKMDHRVRNTYCATGYRSVRVAAEEGRTYTQASGDAHLRASRTEALNQSRQFDRDNGIYRGMITRAVNYIVGNGFALQANTTSKVFNVKVEQLWKDWWRKPEIRSLLIDQQVERMVCREMLVAGDHLVIKTDLGKIQLIESEQIVGPRKTAGDGIKKNTITGACETFYVGSYTRGRMSGEKAKPYAANTVLFLTDPDRPSATRSVPPCQSVFPMLHRINDVCDSEAIAWQMLSRIAISVNRENGPELGYDESEGDGNPSNDDSELSTRLTELGYALMFHAAPGETISGIDRNIPGKDFTASLTMFLRLLGLPLGLPLEVILLDWTKSNYSQSRAVLEQAYQTFLAWQKLLEMGFYREVYEWKVREWVASGAIRPTGNPLKHEWIKPTFPWIDQLKEAQAYGMKLDRSLTTHGAVCKSLNLNREDVVATRVAEIDDAIQKAQALEEKYPGVKVPWQPFAGLEAPKAAPPQAQPQADADADTDTDADDKNGNADEEETEATE